jgi:hypothetical protein
MRLTLDEVANFSKCPRYYQNLKGYVLPKSRRLSIIEKVMRRAYTRRTEYEKKSEWKSITGWIDREVFKDVDIDDEESFQAARKFSESILTFVQKWYEFDYIRSTVPSYIDIPVGYDFVSHIVVGEIPLIHVHETPMITYIDELDYDSLKIYNNIKVMSWACLLMEQLNIDQIKVRHLFVGPKSGFTWDPATIKRNKCPTTKETVKEIAYSIAAGISYPSYTDMCNGCQFYRRCKI